MTHIAKIPTVYRINGLQWVSLWVAIPTGHCRTTDNGRSRLVEALSTLCSGGTYHLYHDPPRIGSSWLVFRVEMRVDSAEPQREAARTLAMEEIHWRLENNHY